MLMQPLDRNLRARTKDEVVVLARQPIRGWRVRFSGGFVGPSESES